MDIHKGIIDKICEVCGLTRLLYAHQVRRGGGLCSRGASCLNLDRNRNFGNRNRMNLLRVQFNTRLFNAESGYFRCVLSQLHMSVLTNIQLYVFVRSAGLQQTCERCHLLSSSARMWCWLNLNRSTTTGIKFVAFAVCLNNNTYTHICMYIDRNPWYIHPKWHIYVSFMCKQSSGKLSQPSID